MPRKPRFKNYEQAQGFVTGQMAKLFDAGEGTTERKNILQRIRTALKKFGKKFDTKTSRIVDINGPESKTKEEQDEERTERRMRRENLMETKQQLENDEVADVNKKRRKRKKKRDEQKRENEALKDKIEQKVIHEDSEEEDYDSDESDMDAENTTQRMKDYLKWYATDEDNDLDTKKFLQDKIIKEFLQDNSKKMYNLVEQDVMKKIASSDIISDTVQKSTAILDGFINNEVEEIKNVENLNQNQIGINENEARTFQQDWWNQIQERFNVNAIKKLINKPDPFSIFKANDSKEEKPEIEFKEDEFERKQFESKESELGQVESYFESINNPSESKMVQTDDVKAQLKDTLMTQIADIASESNIKIPEQIKSASLDTLKEVAKNIDIKPESVVNNIASSMGIPIDEINRLMPMANEVPGKYKYIGELKDLIKERTGGVDPYDIIEAKMPDELMATYERMMKTTELGKVPGQFKDIIKKATGGVDPYDIIEAKVPEVAKATKMVAEGISRVANEAGGLSNIQKKINNIREAGGNLKDIKRITRYLHHETAQQREQRNKANEDKYGKEGKYGREEKEEKRDILGQVIDGADSKSDPGQNTAIPNPGQNIADQINNINQRLEDLSMGKSDGMKYPDKKPIKNYRFPEPNENYNAAQLIQNATTSYLNDYNMYGDVGTYDEI
jgi:hypothetical protein